MRPRPSLPALLAFLLAVPAARAQDEAPADPPRPAVTWPREGLAQVPAALAEAAVSGKRVLVGLAGSPG